jgi:hypothetical protein
VTRGTLPSRASRTCPRVGQGGAHRDRKGDGDVDIIRGEGLVREAGVASEVVERPSRAH